MKLIQFALLRPITILVGILAIAFFSILTIVSMKIDIFPSLGLPVIYVAQPYGGLSPDQMEGFIASYYEYHFLYITGVKKVESKSVQGASLIKVEFHEGTNMSQAMAEVVGYVNRSRAFMPPGTVPPFITRFDTGSVPVGQLVFTSETRDLGEISDLALFRVRPMFSSLPGVSAPPPFGGNQKTVLVKLDPERVRFYNFSPEQILERLLQFNKITPAGNIRIGDYTYITPQNSTVETLEDLENIPLKLGAGASVYLKDVGKIQMGTDIVSGYALVNGKRSVYIPVTKRADASTWEVVQNVRKALPTMRDEIPEDIKVEYVFDQSGYVINALKSVLFEGVLGAFLTGLMVLLFLRDSRGAFIVVLTIPIALFTSLIFLNLFNETVNIMTLGGLALSIGILVDEATVTIENIHRHFELNEKKLQSNDSSIQLSTKAISIWEACKEIVIPKLLILFSILTVFAPAFFMTGVPRGMFLPLSLAVGFAMIASFILSMTFVPILSIWLMNPFYGEKQESQSFVKYWNQFQKLYLEWIKDKIHFSKKWISILLGFAGIILLFSSLFMKIELFPKTDSGQTQVRLRLPTGTRLERTEIQTQKLIQISEKIVGKNNLEISSAFVGTQPSSYPVNLIHLWTSGPHESVSRMKISRSAKISILDFQEKLRTEYKKEFPDSQLSFEPGDIVEQIMNLGASNPIEIHIQEKDFSKTKEYALKTLSLLKNEKYLRDVQIATAIDYPTIRIQTNRMRAGQLGVTLDEVSNAVVTSTSSSRFTKPSFWLDQKTGTAYQVQIEYPQYRMNSIQELESIPITGGEYKVYLRDLAETKTSQTPGEYHRVNQKRVIRITANLYNVDLGKGIRLVENKLKELGALPTGLKVDVKGQKEVLEQTQKELAIGLLIAVIVVFLMLLAYYQSLRVALVTISIVPFVLSGSLLFLLITGHSLNIQSFLGAIMAIGVSVANSILFVSSAEGFRKENQVGISIEAAKVRLRPILMTNFAMVAGMLPMASGFGEGSDSVAPLGVAVIGGLVFSMIATLLYLPMVYALVMEKIKYQSPSLYPEDLESKYYFKGKQNEINP